jgi:DNA-directed RNA polymerase specialized sigma24 family protein
VDAFDTGSALALDVSNREPSGISAPQEAPPLAGHLRDDEALDHLPGQDLAAMSLRVDHLLQDPRVTPACRAVLVLHFQQDMTLADVAAVLDIALGTVKSRLAYGLAILRRHHGDESHD